MVSIHTNLSSLIAQGSLTKSTNTLNRAIEQMSTGYKINHASDNAANYSIKTNMDTKIGAYQVAEENAMMGLDMINSTSDNLTAISERLSRIRALAVQAQNGVFGATSLSAMNREADALLNEINRINATAEYNGIKLFGTDKKEVTNAGKELELNEQGFLQDVVKVDTTGMTALSSMADDVTLAVGEYTISSKEELIQLKEMSDLGLLERGSTFVLTADINMAGVIDWHGIGKTNAFCGVFNGNGYTISNLTGSQGLFSNVARKTDAERWSEVKNVKLKNVKIYANAWEVGTLCGKASDAKITNCSVIEGNVVSTYGRYHGGILGYGYYANTFYCYFDGSVNGKNHVGGIVGFANTGCAPENCFVDADILGVDNVGGVAGYGGMKNSKMIGSVVGDSRVGGLTGQGDSRSSFFCGTVNGIDSVGGISGGTTDFNNSNIINCIFEGEIYGISNVGVFIGLNYNGKVSSIADSYYYGKLVSNLSLAASIGTTTISNITDITIPTEYSLQIGTHSDPASSSLSCTTYIDFGGLQDILSLGLESSDTIERIDELSKIIALKQTELGTVSNRLQSVLEEISVQYENLVSSRSTIQDADMSEVSATYIQQQILQQASATLMATANQTPAIALQLL